MTDDRTIRLIGHMTDRTIRQIEAARFAPGDRVRIVQLDAVPDWVGRTGTVLEVRAGGLWPVRVDLDTTYTPAGDVERLPSTINFAGAQIVKHADDDPNQPNRSGA